MTPKWAKQTCRGGGEGKRRGVEKREREEGRRVEGWGRGGRGEGVGNGGEEEGRGEGEGRGVGGEWRGE